MTQTREVYDNAYYKDYDLLLRVPLYKNLIAEVALLVNPQKNDSIIIFGAGTGNEALEITNLQKPGKIVGVDLSERMLEIAKKKVPGMTIIHSDMMNYSSDKLYDKAVAVRVLDHLENIEKGLEIVMSSVRKGGEIVITLPLDADMKKIWKESARDAVRLALKLRFKKVLEGVVAGVKTGKHSKALVLDRKKNSKKTKLLVDSVRNNCYITYKKHVYGGQDVLIRAVKK